jgi:hypothetical protein
MSEEKDGGSAFPSHGSMGEIVTIRDYFAAKAIQGFCANPSDAMHDFNPEYEKYKKGSIPKEYKQAANRAYLMADAMLAERQKQKDG